MKTYQYFYRKRGLPKSELKTSTVEASGFHDANSKAAEIVGKDCVVVRVVRRKDKQHESIELPEVDL